MSIRSLSRIILALSQDVRSAARQGWRRPGHYGLIILILGFSLGANCAIFSKLNQLLFHPLPGKEPERVVQISMLAPEGHYPTVSYLDLKDFQEQSRLLEQISGLGIFRNAILRGAGEPASVRECSFTPELPEVLGFNVLLGRKFEPADCLPNSAPVALISYQFWTARFNGRSDILGQSINLDDESRTIVGVLPRDFWIPHPGSKLGDALESQNTSMVLTPMVPLPWMLQMRGARGIFAFARLKPNVTIEQARAEMADISRRLELRYPESNRNTRSQLLELRNMLVGEQKSSLLFVFCAVGVVLLIACANISNLLLAQATIREREMAVRVSMGASSWNLARQLLTENLTLGLVGGLAGLLVAVVGQNIFDLFSSDSGMGNSGLQLDWPVLNYTLGVSLLTGLLFGMAPIWQISHLHLSDSLKETGWSASICPRKSRVQKLLVWVEIALSMVLLTGAGLLAHSLWHLSQGDPGFRPYNVLYIKVTPSNHRLGSHEQKVVFYSQLQAGLQAIPGVERASLSISAPMSGESSITDGLRLAEKPEVPVEKYLMEETVMPGYFSTLGIPIKNGRDFNELDGMESPKVAIINEALARKYWGNLNPVGTHLLGEGKTFTVVGVVGDTHHDSLETMAEPYLYRPCTQQGFLPGMFVIVRGRDDAEGLPEKLKQALRTMDPAMFVNEPVLLGKALRSTLASRHEMLATIGCFVLLALLLTVAGIYGVLANFVAQRRREIGIRLAMGAGSGNLITLVMRQALWITLVGIAAGSATAFGLSRYIANQLFGVTKDDPFSYFGTAMLFLAVAAIAAYVPARRATSIDPIVSLRNE